jgi:hypothetical protein
MAAKKTSKTSKKTGKVAKRRMCPLLQGQDCAGPRCALYHKAKKSKYSRCSIAEIAQGINSLSFRVGELGPSDDEFEDEFEDSEGLE